MAIELQMLGWATVLGFVYVFVAAGLVSWQRGLKWNIGNRDDTLQPLGKYAQRANRASRNFLETFPFFAAITLAVVVADRTGAQTALGAEIYLISRLIYLPVYIIGIPYLRSLAYIASIWGILQLLEVILN